MTIVNIREAKASLSRLVAQVEAGEDVVIARDGRPVARLVAIEPPAKREFGTLKGRIKLDDSFFEPLPAHELDAWDNA